MPDDNLHMIFRAEVQERGRMILTIMDAIYCATQKQAIQMALLRESITCDMKVKVVVAITRGERKAAKAIQKLVDSRVAAKRAGCDIDLWPIDEFVRFMRG